MKATEDGIDLEREQFRDDEAIGLFDEALEHRLRVGVLLVSD